MNAWETRLTEDLSTIIRLNVSVLGKIIYKLDEEDRQKWIDTMKEEIHGTCSLFVEEATFFVSIQYLRKNCSKLCELLQMDMPSYDSEKLTLYEEKKLLENYRKEFEEDIKDKQAKFKEMTIKQVTLCRQLEEIPKMFVEKSVPTSAELQSLSAEIKRLENDWQEIKSKFDETKENIENSLKKLNLDAAPEIQLIVNPINNIPVTKTKDKLQLLVNYYEILKDKQELEEDKQIKSLKTVIYDLYDTCHIAMPDRRITQNSTNHTLDEIQQEINKLKGFWEDNEETFQLFEKYNQNWMKLSKLTEECQKYVGINRKVVQVKGLCEQIHRIEGKLIDTVIEYEVKHIKPFTTFGQTIPDVIAKLHDSFGKLTITELSVEKTLSSIILHYEEKVEVPQYESVDRQMDNILMSCDSNSSSETEFIETEFIENEDTIKEEIESIREDSPLLLERTIIEESNDTETSMTTLHSDPFNSEFNLQIPSYPSNKENSAHQNISNEEAPLFDFLINGPSTSNTLFKRKSKNHSKCKTERINPYRSLSSSKKENTAAPNNGMFQSKIGHKLRDLLSNRTD